MRHIFDRFYTGRGGNTGIGLSIAKELIGLHSWKLTAQRTEQGIAFMIRLEG
jgi:signal transduction histidine kinase